MPKQSGLHWMRVWHRRPSLCTGWGLYASTGTVDGIGLWQTASQSQPVSRVSGHDAGRRSGVPGRCARWRAVAAQHLREDQPFNAIKSPSGPPRSSQVWLK